MIATPHFYAWNDRIEDFLKRRKAAFEAIKEKKDSQMPDIKLGAEIAFFKGISHAERIDALKTEGTDSILLEMPFEPWEKEHLDEVRALIDRRGFKVILAHIERYMRISGNISLIQEVMHMPVKLQINAESLTDWRQRRKLVRMFRNEEVHLLGSDCHGIHHRPPNLDLGRSILTKKLGNLVLERVDRCGERIYLEG